MLIALPSSVVFLSRIPTTMGTVGFDYPPERPVPVYARMAPSGRSWTVIPPSYNAAGNQADTGAPRVVGQAGHDGAG